MTATVVLREVTTSDLPTLYVFQDDPEANRMAAFPPRDREAFMAHWERILADPALVARTIMFEGEVAGSVSLFGTPEKRLVGYWIGRQYWGRGVASAALASLLIEFSERPLFAHVAKHNVGSIRVLKKCGFEVIGEDSVELESSRQTIEEFVMRLSD